MIAAHPFLFGFFAGVVSTIVTLVVVAFRGWTGPG